MSRTTRIAASLIVTAIILAAAGRSPALAQDLGEIARGINAQRMRASSGLFDPESNADAVPIAPGQTVILAELAGPGEIRHMWFTIGAFDRRYTRSVVLRIFWDGAEAPSVEAPIGDFFAAGNGMRANVSSLPIEVTSYGRALNSYWWMPFRTSARVTMTNESDKPVTSCYYYIDWLKLDAPPRDLRYFHGRYRQEFPVKAFSPYTVADIAGSGHYVGTVLSIQASVGSWLGESDDRFYIDGEQVPSLVGTGLEDYFTDAWNLRQFTNLRAGVSIYEPKGRDQRATMYRWHIADPITFRKALKVEIERRSYAMVVDPATGREITWDFKYRPDFLSSVAFWYATEPAPRLWKFPPLAERVNPEIFVETTLMVDQLQVSPNARAVRRYTRSTNAATGEARQALTYVEGAGPGAWLEVPVDVREAGDYAVGIYQILHGDSGIWKVTMKGPGFDRLLHPAMDFYDKYATYTFNMPENYLYGTWFENKVGVFTLSPGSYTIRFECVGSNAMARSSGVSYLQSGTRVVDADHAGATGYGMALDGISLRKLPWQDMWAWMQHYLKREEALFAERVSTARVTVQALAAAIERYKADLGEYPRELSDLQAPPTRLATRKGAWPYVQRGAIPLDPWGQLYRYLAPGRHNAQSFDVWSVHGNEREPKGWIGNW